MHYFLGFNLYFEQTKTGQWTGYAVNEQIKIPERQYADLATAKKLVEYEILCHHCRSDMGASFIVDSQWVMRFYNLPCDAFIEEISKADIDYSQPGTVLCNGRFDNKKAQYRINIRAFEHFSLCKILGVYTEPNLLMAS